VELGGGTAAFVVLFHVGTVTGLPQIGASIDVSRQFGFAQGAATFFAFVLVVSVAGTLYRARA
jgi:hypothetical protein